MAGRGPTAKDQRRRSNEPERGEWRRAPGAGWQHGPIPRPPDGLLKASRDAWATWFRAWFAAHWAPDDVPALRQLVRLYDQVERGEYQRAGELRLWMDTCGVSKKGQQDRRWSPPLAPVRDEERPDTPPGSPYGHLSVAK